MYPVYLIMTTGRTGSDYLQACLDNVKGVMTFCGKFEYHNFFFHNKELSNENLIEKFIKKNKKIFSYDEFEGIDTKIDTNKFKNLFLKINSDKIKSRKDFLINLYKAYHLTLGRDLDSVRALVHHSHGYENTIQCLKDFPHAKLLITIRDPRANLKSGLENWFKYDSSKRNMEHVYLYMKRIKHDLVKSQKLKNDKLFVQLESMGDINTKKKICNFLGVDYSTEIEKATINSIIWRGDVLSQNKSKQGEFIENVKNNEWKNYFLESEINILNFLYEEYQRFGYDLKKINFFERIILLVKSIKLFSFEKKIFFNDIFLSKKTFLNFYNYLKIRILLIFISALKLK